MLHILHHSVYGLVQLIQSVLVPICFGVAWLLVGILFWSMWTAVRDVVSDAKQMHEIPCANCKFFTNTHFLKCPVHPIAAGSTAAINCPDYQSATYTPRLDD